jgi:hypothetical protein
VRKVGVDIFGKVELTPEQAQSYRNFYLSEAITKARTIIAGIEKYGEEFKRYIGEEIIRKNAEIATKYLLKKLEDINPELARRRDAETWATIAKMTIDQSPALMVPPLGFRYRVLEVTPRRARIEILECPFYNIWKIAFNNDNKKCYMMCEMSAYFDGTMIKLINPNLVFKGSCADPKSGCLALGTPDIAEVYLPEPKAPFIRGDEPLESAKADWEKWFRDANNQLWDVIGRTWVSVCEMEGEHGRRAFETLARVMDRDGRQLAKALLPVVKPKEMNAEAWTDVKRFLFESGPNKALGLTVEIVERRPERVVLRVKKCIFLDIWKNVSRLETAQLEKLCKLAGMFDRGVAKEINPKIELKSACLLLNKSGSSVAGLLYGTAPYCEFIVELPKETVIM